MTTTEKWRLVYPGYPEDRDDFPSQSKAYEFVASLRNAWRSGASGSVRQVTVRVNEGRGWKTHEHVDFADN